VIQGLSLNFWRPCLLVLFSAIAVAQALAEVYEWVDDKGRKQFSDKPPPAAGTAFERRLYDLENIDEGYPAPVVHNPQTPEQQALAAKQAEARRKALESACRKARQQLWVLRGPVIYRDADGNNVPVSEAQREAHAERLNAAIEKRC
jgi:hypothetical protein